MDRIADLEECSPTNSGCWIHGKHFLSKLVERVVAKQLLEHILVHDLDNSFQSAHKRGHLIGPALLHKNDFSGLGIV